MPKSYDLVRTWAVFFDMDGVLIDSYQAPFEAWQKILPALGLAMTDKQFAPLFGRTNPVILAALFPLLPPERYPAIDKEKEALFREIPTCSTSTRKARSTTRSSTSTVRTR